MLNKYIIINPDFWDMIVEGDKKLEFRKLSKGYESGLYHFLDADALDKAGVTIYKGRTGKFIQDYCMYDGEPVKNLDDFEIGIAHLKARMLNPTIYLSKENGEKNYYCMSKEKLYFYNKDITKLNKFIDMPNITIYKISKQSFEFVFNNYKNIHDFIGYEISEITNFTK